MYAYFVLLNKLFAPCFIISNCLITIYFFCNIKNMFVCIVCKVKISREYWRYQYSALTLTRKRKAKARQTIQVHTHCLFIVVSISCYRVVIATREFSTLRVRNVNVQRSTFHAVRIVRSTYNVVNEHLCVYIQIQYTFSLAYLSEPQI